MPASFCFKKPDGENELLNIIDDKIAEFLGETPSKEYNRHMDYVSDIGFSILYSSEGCAVDEKKFNAWLSNTQVKYPNDYAVIIKASDGKLVPCLRKFLYQDYTFKAWR
jgi:hypothetical protein